MPMTIPVKDIDLLILPTIITLNLKGYKTKFCCSGHVLTPWKFRNRRKKIKEAMTFRSYISFENYVESIPSGFGRGVKPFNLNAIYLKESVRECARSRGTIGRLKALYCINKELWRWALSLPRIK